MVVNENPPISGLDQPSLEPNIQPRSMLLGGVEAQPVAGYEHWQRRASARRTL